MLAVFPFYIFILGFRGSTNSSLLLPWVPKPVLWQSLRGLVLSLFLIIFSFWCCLSKSPLLTFHSEVSLGSWPQLLGFLPFQTQLLVVLLLIIFLRWAESIPTRLKVFPTTFPYSSSFWIPWDATLLAHEWLLQALQFLAASLGAWEGHICPLFLVFFLVLPLNCLNPISAMLHALRIPSPWQPLRISTQFFPLDSL